MEKDRCPGGLDISTYHYSASDVHCGCKGFDCDTAAARDYTAGLVKKFNEIYGATHQVVHAIQMGVETDKDAFIFHGDVSGTVLNIAEALDLSKHELEVKLRTLYPDMKDEIFRDLMPFALGNQRHVRKVIESNRPIEKLDHGEQIIGVGRGFDWLHLTNKALIVGPFSMDWIDEVVVAAKIVLSNFEKGRIPTDDGAVILVSAPFRKYGVDAAIAKEKALETARLSYKAIQQHVPELLAYDIDLVVGAFDRNTMLLERFETTPEALLATA
jgi:soluble P-type ATPase